MSDNSYRASDDMISRRRSGYRKLEDTPAVREFLEAEKKRKEAAKVRKLAAAAARKAA